MNIQGQNDPQVQKRILSKAFLKEEKAGVKTAIVKGRIIIKGEELFKPLGMFGTWIDDDLSITHQHALRLKRCAEAEAVYGVHKMLNFRASALMVLMAKSVPRAVMEKAIMLAAAGETITCKRAADLIVEEKSTSMRHSGKLRAKPRAEKISVSRTVEGAAKFLQSNFTEEEQAEVSERLKKYAAAARMHDQVSASNRLSSSVKWVKPARLTSEFFGVWAHYLIKDNWIYASNGHLDAAAPFPCDQNFGVRGILLDRLIDDAVEIRVEGDSAVITNRDGWSSKIELTDINAFEIDTELKGEVHQVSSLLMGAIRSLSPLTDFGTETSVTGGTLLYHGCAYVYPNWAIAWVDEIGIDLDLLIPKILTEFVAPKHGSPIEIVVDDETIAFRWEDGAWARARRESVEKVFSNAPTVADLVAVRERFVEPAGEIAKEWRSAYKFIARLKPDRLRIYRDRISPMPNGTHVDHLSAYAIEVFVETPLPNDPNVEFLEWPRTSLNILVDIADSWQPECAPDHIPFRGGNVCGFLIKPVQTH